MVNTEVVKIRELAIDLETYSSAPIKYGVYKYVSSHDFEILLFSYSYDDGPVFCVDFTKGQKIPQQVYKDLTNPNVVKTAANAAFEMTCLSKEFDLELDPTQWECTLVKCGMLGLPMNLADLSRVLKIVDGKLEYGHALIRYFCIPCKPTKANGFRTRNLPSHAPDKWQLFVEYNIRDVQAEKQIRKKVSWFTIPEREKLLWGIDQKINRLGIRVDITLLKAAIKIDQEYQQELMTEAITITGLQNPKSVQQIKKWLEKAVIEEEEKEKFDSNDRMPAIILPKLIEKFESKKIKRVLRIRQEISKTSIRKYTTMLAAVGPDERIRGTTQFYGANRTGRFAGRIIQPHNYPKNYIKDLDLARRIVRTGNTNAVKTIFDSVPHTLSQLLRTSFIPRDGCEYLIDDYSAIEARVLAWLAGEEWVLEVFRGDGLIYEATAANMFKIPIESIDKKSPYRYRGKVANLACGYGGSVGALIKMGALDMGIAETELPYIVAQYRQASPNIVNYWGLLQDAVFEALSGGEVVPLTKGMKVQYKKRCLFITLPSGRNLVYCNPRAGYDGLTYWGLNQTSKKWEEIRTYGGKLTENVTQAVARDVLAEGLINLDAHGLNIPLHIHDEVILEELIGKYNIHEISQLLCPDIPWAKGLPLAAEGFKNNYYKKE